MKAPYEKPDVTIVLCTCNRAAPLVTALESLVKQETGGRFAYEILIVDDGSTDETKQVAIAMQQAHSLVRYLYKEGGGVADARNFGVRHAQGEWIAFFDDDQLAEPDWLATLLATAELHSVPCVGGTRALRMPADAPLVLGERVRGLLGEHGITRPIAEYGGWELPNTGNALIHKTILAEIGVFDLALREGGEDTDFFHRAQMAGFALRHSPAALVWHVIPAARLSPDYLRWAAHKSGVAAVRLYHQAGGNVYVLLQLVAFWFHAAGRATLPWCWAQWRDDRQAALNSRCAFDFAVGYTRACLRLWMPQLFQQTQFMQYVDFRLHGGERLESNPVTTSFNEAAS